MHQLVRTAVAAALILTASFVSAQSLSFGDRFPLTNTRYVTTSASDSRLVSNGREFFLFWRTATNVRLTKLVAGDRRGGRHVMTRVDDMDVVWTGSGFLMAGSIQNQNTIYGQLVDASGEPQGSAFVIGSGRMPRLAATANGVLMVYVDGALKGAMLTPRGTVLAPAQLPASQVNGYSVSSNGTGFAVAIAEPSFIEVVLLDGSGRQTSRTTAYNAFRPVVSVDVASNGDEYLVAWSAYGEQKSALQLDASGTARAPVTFEEPTQGETAGGVVEAAWTGANWAVAYTTHKPHAVTPELHVAWLDPVYATVIGREPQRYGLYPSLASANGRALLTWRTEYGGPVLWGDLPLSADVIPLTHAAAEQTLGAAVSSSNATLVVWREASPDAASTRFGIRDRDGSWRERELVPAFTQVMAASDGQEFVMVTPQGSGSVARFVNEQGRSVGQPVAIPFQVRSIAWSGRDYVLSRSYYGAGEPEFARLSTAGVLTAGAAVTPADEWRLVNGIASNGTTTIGLWLYEEPCQITCPTIGRVKFARLGADLQPLETPRLLVDEIVQGASILWDGRRFLAFIGGGESAIRIWQIPQNGGGASPIATLGAGGELLDTARVDAGLAVTWRERGAGGRVHVSLVGHDNQVRQLATTTAGSSERARVVGLPGNAIGVVDATPNFDAPHHGSTRITMQIADAVQTGVPDAPHLRLERRDGKAVLRWTTPSQPVSGYRVEYRIGDGSWNEFDAWIDADETEAPIGLNMRPGVTYRFRIRAWSDAGRSERSNAVAVNGSKRRAVR
ncbi:MAG TPA: fibronectin type III domain-containing protein [Thermoanaerobaculia bacterium]|jgi:hypothetical protein